MERHDVLELMGQLKLAGMRAAYDEIVGAGVKRKHSVGWIVGDLLAAEVADKKARSIRYRLSTAKLPMARDLSDFDFKASPVNEALVRELHDGGFVHISSHASDPLPAAVASIRTLLPWKSSVLISSLVKRRYLVVSFSRGNGSWYVNSGIFLYPFV